jgi:hypothetical protein
MSNAWILPPIVVIDVLFVFNLAAILEHFYFHFHLLQLTE